MRASPSSPFKLFFRGGSPAGACRLLQWPLGTGQTRRGWLGAAEPSAPGRAGGRRRESRLSSEAGSAAWVGEVRVVKLRWPHHGPWLCQVVPAQPGRSGWAPGAELEASGVPAQHLFPGAGRQPCSCRAGRSGSPQAAAHRAPRDPAKGRAAPQPGCQPLGVGSPWLSPCPPLLPSAWVPRAMSLPACRAGAQNWAAGTALLELLPGTAALRCPAVGGVSSRKPGRVLLLPTFPPADFLLQQKARQEP